MSHKVIMKFSINTLIKFGHFLINVPKVWRSDYPIKKPLKMSPALYYISSWLISLHLQVGMYIHL